MDRRCFLKSVLCTAAGGALVSPRAVLALERPLRTETLPPVSEMMYFGGGWKMHMYAGRTTDISLSTLVRSPSGRLVMVDGGWGADGEFLLGELKRLGGEVDTWFLTHAHSDHRSAALSTTSSRWTSSPRFLRRVCRTSRRFWAIWRKAD